jgi:hypothetical protein
MEKPEKRWGEVCENQQKLCSRIASSQSMYDCAFITGISQKLCINTTVKSKA